MAATGYTPISLYYSTTAAAVPVNTNLVNGELAINITDGKLYYKDNAGVVQVIAGKGGAGVAGGSNTQVQYNSSGSLAGSANMTFNGTALTLANDASISGFTVGLGGGAVGYNTAVGRSVLAANTTGSVNAGFGFYALLANTTGSQNSAFGVQALQANTTASNNTAVGYQANYSNTTSSNITAMGYQALYNNTSFNDAFGAGSLYSNTSGNGNAAFGQNALNKNTTGVNNIAVGLQSLYNNTTASNNTAVGYQAGYAATTSGDNTFLGYQAGLNTTGNRNTIVGFLSGGGLTSGTFNNFFGTQAGQAVTTGGKNSILGSYSGNQGGLDIRTASNYIVLSDGDGNPRGFWSGGTFILPAYSGGYTYNNSDTGFYCDGGYGQGLRFGNTYGAGKGYVQFTYNGTTIGQISASTTSSVAYQTTSDYRLKENVEPMQNALATVAQLKPVTYTWKIDGSNGQGFIAHELQKIVPEAVVGEKDAVNEDGSIKPQGIDTSFLVATLTAAIQELNAKVTALEAGAKA